MELNPMSFDPKEFLSQTYDDPNSTHATPIPEGEYDAIIRSHTDPKEFARDDGTKTLVVDINWLIEDASGKIAAKTNRKENFARQSLFLDVVVDGMGTITGLDMRVGNNVSLGRLREAVGL